jgi:hypothetical protein
VERYGPLFPNRLQYGERCVARAFSQAAENDALWTSHRFLVCSYHSSFCY